MSPASAASWWKYIHRFCVCTHALRHAGGARRRVDQEHVVGSVGAAGRRRRRRRPGIGRRPVVVDAPRGVRADIPRPAASSTSSAVGRPRCSASVTSASARVRREEVAQLVVAGAVAEPDDGEARRARRRRTRRGRRRRRGGGPRPGRLGGARYRRARARARWPARRSRPRWRGGRRRRARRGPAGSRAQPATASPTVVSPHHPAARYSAATAGSGCTRILLLRRGRSVPVEREERR